MSSTLSFHVPKALPCLIPYQQYRSLLPISSHLNHSHRHSAKQSYTHNKQQKQNNSNSSSSFHLNKPSLAIQVAAVLATVGEQPALAVTGSNNYSEDLGSLLIQAGIVGFLYFIIAPPLIMNWMRTRWYKRNLVEMYFQFMFTFIFFPGLLIWAPFLNFRKLPRDPSMKYPWSVPKDPSKIKSGYLKYPFAKPEDYTVD
uniref:NADH dehydrogenase-like complex L n=1 Tax=California macrophylla TaxID=337344 RepID=A0A0F7CYX6_9ROSI